jgi:WhiB family redox-sensing transcriptional regulator
MWAVETDDESLPCRTEQADLWFAEHPEQLGRAQNLCHGCPIRRQCLAGALRRREPWGVWGGEIFERGRVIPFKRGRGRPAKVRAERSASGTSIGAERSASGTSIGAERSASGTSIGAEREDTVA